MDYQHMPARALLARLAQQSRSVVNMAGIPAEHIRRAIGEVLAFLADPEAEAWEPLAPATLPANAYSDEHIAAIAAETRMDVETVRAELQRQAADTAFFRNSTYQVAVRRTDGPVHLSIKRLDQRAIRDWRVMQRIKNELVGPECEAVEIYPAESRLVDTANQYHLWAFPDPTYRIPFGFDRGLVTEADHGSGAVQRKRA